MRFLPALLLTLSVPVPLAAQVAVKVIDHTKARLYINEDIIVEGPLVRADRAGGGAIWFSLGKPHPSATLVIVVPAAFATNFDPPRDWEGKTVQVSGRVTTGEAEGIGVGGSSGRSRMTTATPRNPFIILEDPSKLRIVSPLKPKAPPQTP